jgi:hypothetical protein
MVWQGWASCCTLARIFDHKAFLSLCFPCYWNIHASSHDLLPCPESAASNALKVRLKGIRARSPSTRRRTPGRSRMAYSSRNISVRCETTKSRQDHRGHSKPHREHQIDGKISTLLDVIRIPCRSLYFMTFHPLDLISSSSLIPLHCLLARLLPRDVIDVNRSETRHQSERNSRPSPQAVEVPVQAEASAERYRHGDLFVVSQSDDRSNGVKKRGVWIRI